MGNKAGGAKKKSKSRTNKDNCRKPVDIDFIHGLSHEHRVEYLVFGFIRSLDFSQTLHIPDDMKLLFGKYLDIHIESETELRQKEDDQRKTCMLGASMVGKTSVVLRMVANEWRHELDATIEDSYTCTLTVDAIETRLDILDTSGLDAFAALRHHWIRENDVFIICYSITNQSSFKHVDELWRKVVRNKDLEDERIDVVLCATKSDLESRREVTKEEGQKKAEQLGIPFVETSAKTGENITLLFETVVREIRKR